MSAGTIYDIGIVDVAAHKVADQFWCYSPAVSPDGRYVAFKKFFGPHSSPSPDDHNMLYLVARSAEENRPPGIFPDNPVDVGFAMYPAGVGKGIDDNGNVPSELAHLVAGQYFWKGARQYFFADRTPAFFADGTPGKLSVVWVTIGREEANVRRLAIDPPEPLGKLFPLRLSDLSAEVNTLKLTLLSNISQSMVVRLSDFGQLCQNRSRGSTEG